MIVEYNIGSLAAELRCTALSARYGGVIYQGLKWLIYPIVNGGKQSEACQKSHDAQPLFHLSPGEYAIHAFYQEQEHDLGTVKLGRNTRTDAVFILEVGSDDAVGEYFADHDPVEEYGRRLLERDGQRSFGSATTPIQDPYANQGEGQGFAQHPVLQKAQFQGTEPKVLPTPDNTTAVQKTLTLQLENNPQPGMTMSTPRPV